MSFFEAALYLENGHLFEGKGFGAEISKGGEAVFNTGMSGYQEIFEVLGGLGGLQSDWVFENRNHWRYARVVTKREIISIF